MTENGILYLVATPIGNLEDITLRAVRTLKEVDIVLCEDTSRSIKLLNHYGIKKPLFSYYKPKEKEKITKILRWLSEGKNIALITDAGTPLVSDPGYILVKEAIASNITVTGVPGPSSVITALSVSGFSADRFVFEGFLPKKAQEIKKRLELIKHLPHPAIFFVPARDLSSALREIRNALGNRRVCVARELTKIHEEIKTGDIDDILELKIEEKGEITLIVAGAEKDETAMNENEIRAFIKKQLAENKTFRDIIKMGEIKGVRRNIIYGLMEELKDE